MRYRPNLLRGIIAALLVTSSARAAGTGDDVTLDIDIVSHRLDVARQQIQPALGATVHRFSPNALAAIPQAPDAPPNEVLL